MTADERLKLVRRKIERADEHIANLDNALRWFIKSNPYKVATKRNSQTRRLIYYLASVAGIPFGIPLITGDILNNLRSALDHLAQQLYLVGTSGESGFRDRTSFSIAPSTKAFEAALPRKVEGMRQDAIDAIKAVEPYKGGHGEDLWVLSRLNNIDKHRLIVTVGASYKSLNIGPMLIKMMKSSIQEDWASDTPEIDLFLGPADNLFPLKTGDELFTDAPDAEENQKTQFRFEIVIHEPGVIEGKPLRETMVQFRDRISSVVDAFKPCLE